MTDSPPVDSLGDESSFLRAVARIPKLSLAPDRQGERLDRFVIGDRLGQGGMGAVYVARDERLGREVALKLLPGDTLSSAEHRARLFSEARAAARVSNPHVAAIYDVGEVEGIVFIAMERIRGQTVRELLDATGGTGLGAARGVELASQLCKGVAAAHEAGLVHRDLKPDNVMVQADGLVKVLDFGLAVSLADVNTDGWVRGGTPGYMAPEQIDGGQLGPAADVFAIGAIMFELLTGRPPFGRGSREEILERVRRDEPDFTTLPVAFVALLRAALAKAPQLRPQNASSFASLLAAADQRRTRRRWALPGLVAGLGLLMLMVLAAYGERAQHRPVRERVRYDHAPTTVALPSTARGESRPMMEPTPRSAVVKTRRAPAPGPSQRGFDPLAHQK